MSIAARVCTQKAVSLAVVTVAPLSLTGGVWADLPWRVGRRRGSRRLGREDAPAASLGAAQRTIVARDGELSGGGLLDDRRRWLG